ncbi:MAG TPA: efflux RND transporter periplasmic adaptor subunit [Acidobacteriota bacterium]|nr:efflux RND transporter periplasmic adaptor subunit [Acidobacteriota bacterium]
MRKERKKWVVAGILVLAALIVFVSVQAVRRPAVEVQTSIVERKETLKSIVSASGEIRAKEYVNLQSEIAGIITELPVREGASVKRGDVLLRIDPIQTAADKSASEARHEAALAEARAQEFVIMNAEANRRRDEASLRSSLAELDLAERNLARVESRFRRQQLLHEDGLISSEEYEVVQNEMRQAQSRLVVARTQTEQYETQIKIAINNIEQNRTNAAAARARVQSAAAELARTSDQLRKTTLYSPLDGVITELMVEIGERAQPGIMSSPEATLMTISNLSVIQVELTVDETDVVSLSLGDKAQVEVDALPKMVFEGEVTEIGNSPIRSATAQEARDFRVVITLNDPSQKLRIGMSCTGEIITDTKENVLVIPIQALTVREVEVDQDGKYHPPDLGKKREAVASADSMKEKSPKKELEGVFVIDENRIARFRDIQTGITGESDIEVLENLKEGERIITGTFQTLRTITDGTQVKFNNQD